MSIGTSTSGASSSYVTHTKQASQVDTPKDSRFTFLKGAKSKVTHVWAQLTNTTPLTTYQQVRNLIAANQLDEADKFADALPDGLTKTLCRTEIARAYLEREKLENSLEITRKLPEGMYKSNLLSELIQRFIDLGKVKEAHEAAYVTTNLDDIRHALKRVTEAYIKLGQQEDAEKVADEHRKRDEEYDAFLAQY